MNKLRSIMAYFSTMYPHKSELSKARLTKLVYLADWFSALLNNQKMSEINWIFNHYGPYVDDIFELASIDNDFAITPEKTPYGDDKHVILYTGEDISLILSEKEKAILDAIINKTKTMYFNEFINYVYSTYPISSNERYAKLDLLALAKKYKEEQSQSS
ncbi:MAG: SocA family protein [Thiomargarita sp.]|nr:SocA family protein [Thiomargarita sp.]